MMLLSDSTSSCKCSDIELDIAPEFIRWFYKDEPSRKWIPFNGYDSLRIETKYRESKLASDSFDDLVDQSTQINDSTAEMIVVRGGLFEVNTRLRKCIPIYWDDHFESEDITDNYQNSDPLKEELRKKKNSPTAPSDQSTDIIRGSWFKDTGSKNQLEPLYDELVAEEIENSHVNYFNKASEIERMLDNIQFPQEGPYDSPIPISKPPLLPVEDSSELNSPVTVNESLPASKDQNNLKTSTRSPIHSLILQEFEIEWFSQDQIYLYNRSATSSLRKKLGISKSGYRLFRGYREEAKIDDKLPDITHLCFVIHGIGQKLATGAIVKVCSDLRAYCNRIRLRYFPDLEKNNKRVEFLPVEWRSSLQLDNGLVDTITPVHMGHLRNLLNSSAMDIMYYSSPLYRPEILQGMRTEMNRLYSMFCARNPYFEVQGGQVSVVAHSLGCVITYDILSGWHLDEITNSSYKLPKSNSMIISNKHVQEVEKLEKNGYIERFDIEDSSYIDEPVPFFIQKSITTTCENLSNNLESHIDRIVSNDFQIKQLKSKLESAKSLVQCLENQMNQLQMGIPINSFVNPKPSKEDIKNLVSKNRLEPNLSNSPFSSPTLSRDSTLDLINPNESNIVACSNVTPKFGRRANFPVNFKSGILWKNVTKLSNFFALGSPLSVFLALRGITPSSSGTMDHILSKNVCERFFNIYHPADPIAYRMEPLLLKHYCAIHPLIIHRVDAQSKPNYDSMGNILLKDKQQTKKFKIPEYNNTNRDYGDTVVTNDSPVNDVQDPYTNETYGLSISDRMMSLFSRRKSSIDFNSNNNNNNNNNNNDHDNKNLNGTFHKKESSLIEILHSRRQTIIDSIKNQSIERSFSSTQGDNGHSSENLEKESGLGIMVNDLIFRNQEDSPENSMVDAQQYFASPQKSMQVHLEHRLDFQLPESRYEAAYISLFTSHNSYWNNPDVALFIMTQLFGEYGPIGKPANSKL